MRHFVTFIRHTDLIKYCEYTIFALPAVAPSRSKKHKIKVGINIAVHQQLKILENDAHAATQHWDVTTTQLSHIISKHTSMTLSGHRNFGI